MTSSALGEKSQSLNIMIVYRLSRSYEHVADALGFKTSRHRWEPSSVALQKHLNLGVADPDQVENAKDMCV